MKKKIARIIVTAACTLASSGAQAAVVFTDTFASGTGSWFTGGNTGTLSNSSGQLSWSTTGTNNDTFSIGRSFTSQTVEVGETIRLTMNYTQNAATASDIIRVGLYDVTNTIAANQWSTTGSGVGAFSGYYGFIRDNGTTSQLRRESVTDTSAVANGPTVNTSINALTSLTGTSTTFDIVQSTSYRIVFELTRTSSTVMSASYMLTSADGLTIHQDITGVHDSTIAPLAANFTSFDSVVIRPNGPILVDNIEVSVIPEPSTALLGGLGILALLRRRR